MKKILYASVVALLFIGCANDATLEETKFGSSLEAETFYTEQMGGIGLVFGTALSGGVLDVAHDFDGTSIFVDNIGFKAGVAKKAFSKKRLSSLSYSSSTGFWSVDTSFNESSEGTTARGAVKGKFRFTPHTVIGLPNDQTETMDYDVDVSFNVEAQGEGSLSFSYSSDVVLTNLVKFRKDSGDARINGTSGFRFGINSTSTLTQNLSYDMTITLKNVDVNYDANSYPLGGTLDFSFHTKSEGKEYLVNGNIVFDGDNTAMMTLGEYTFILDLDTGDIGQL